MASFKAGGEVGVRCYAKIGPFPDEYAVVVETVSGIISGFVKEENMLRITDDIGLIRAIVQDVKGDIVTVWIQGSFFTTNGLADFSQDWASENLEPVPAA